jgi:hypothetical protein
LLSVSLLGLSTTSRCMYSWTWEARSRGVGRARRYRAFVVGGEQVGRRRRAVPRRDIPKVGEGFLPGQQARQGEGNAPWEQSGSLEHQVRRTQRFGQEGLRRPPFSGWAITALARSSDKASVSADAGHVGMLAGPGVVGGLWLRVRDWLAPRSGR